MCLMHVLEPETIESAIPSDGEWFFDLRIALQDEHYQPYGMVASGLTSPCQFQRFLLLPFGCHEFLQAGQSPAKHGAHFSSLGVSEASIASMRFERSKTSIAREKP